MTEDGQSTDQAADDARRGSAPSEDKEDTTVQISRAEIAAIHQSSNDLELTDEERRQIDRRRERNQAKQHATPEPTPTPTPTSEPEPDEEDETRTFDRNELQEIMEKKAAADRSVRPGDDAMAQAAIEEARARSTEPDARDERYDLEDSGLNELSDADMRAIVFGDATSGGDDEPEASPAADEDADSFVDEAASDEAASDEAASDEAASDEAASDDLEELSDAEFDDLAAELSDAALVEDEEDDAPDHDDAPEQAGVPAAPPPAEVIEDGEALGNFRGAESRLLLAGTTLGGLAMLVIGAMRLMGAGPFSGLHPVLAGLFVTLGFLGLVGAFFAMRQG